MTATRVFENFQVETSTTGLQEEHRNCGNCVWVAERAQTYGGLLTHWVRAVLGFLVVEYLCLPLTLMFNDSHQAALLSALSAFTNLRRWLSALTPIQAASEVLAELMPQWHASLAPATHVPTHPSSVHSLLSVSPTYMSMGTLSICLAGHTCYHIPRGGFVPVHNDKGVAAFHSDNGDIAGGVLWGPVTLPHVTWDDFVQALHLEVIQRVGQGAGGRWVLIEVRHIRSYKRTETPLRLLKALSGGRHVTSAPWS